MIVVHRVTAGLQGRTGSYVLNRTPGQTTSAATRDRVLRAAEALGYVPHASARTLARGRSDLILIDASGLPFGQTVGASTQALADAFADRGHTPIVDYSTGGSDSHTLLRALMQLTVPAAVIAVTPLPAELRARLDAAGIPCSEGSPDPGAPGAIPQQIGDAARHQVRYLAQRGHRAIAYARAADPALGRLDGLRARTAVPDELAVIGVDDLPLSAACWPALTTVRYSAPSLEEFTASVEATLAGEPMPFVAIGVPELVQRESARPLLGPRPLAHDEGPAQGGAFVMRASGAPRQGVMILPGLRLRPGSLAENTSCRIETPTGVMSSSIHG